MGIIWMFIVGGLIGWFAGLLLGQNIPGGILGNIVTGIIGSWLGTFLLGGWGPSLGGFYLIPSFIGAIIFVTIIGLLSNILRQWTNTSIFDLIRKYTQFTPILW